MSFNYLKKNQLFKLFYTSPWEKKKKKKQKGRLYLSGWTDILKADSVGELTFSFRLWNWLNERAVNMSPTSLFLLIIREIEFAD